MKALRKQFLRLLLPFAALLLIGGCSDYIMDGADYISKNYYESSALRESTKDTAAPTAAAPETSAPTADLPTAEQAIDENGKYYTKDEVVLYLHTYGHLPSNFMTKSEAQKLGWSGGSLESYAEGMAIGGDTFGNREGLLPKADGRVYHECDIDTLGASSRGAKRIVWSDDGLIFYTDNHYESFTQLY